MSHVSQMELVVDDWEVLKSACKSIGATCEIGESEVSLYASNKRKVHARISLPGWRYQVGISKDGILYYDAFGYDSKAGGTPTAMPHLVRMRNEYTLQRGQKLAKTRRKQYKRMSDRRGDKVEAGWQTLRIYV